MSYTQLLYHVVLRTHKSERTINEKHERELYRYVGDLKISTSKWLKANPNFWLFDGWSKEYAGFSYAFRDKDLIVNYIMRQKEHHREAPMNQ